MDGLYNVVDFTIASGESESSVIEGYGNSTLVGISFDSALDNATLGLQTEVGDAGYKDVYDPENSANYSFPVGDYYTPLNVQITAGLGPRIKVVGGSNETTARAGKAIFRGVS